MLSKNWQQKADGSDVNWGQVLTPPHLTLIRPSAEFWLGPPSIYLAFPDSRAQVPNGDVDYDDGGD